VGEITVEPSYSGPKLEKVEDVTPEWCKSVMQWQKEQKTLHKKFVCMLI
jgi:hypothetical protein